MDYKCGTCGKNVGEDLLTFIDHTEGHIVDEIKAKHPEWVESDGVCKPCVEYFRSQIKGKGNN